MLFKELRIAHTSGCKILDKFEGLFIIYYWEKSSLVWKCMDLLNDQLYARREEESSECSSNFGCQ